MGCELGRGGAGADVQGYDWGFEIAMDVRRFVSVGLWSLRQLTRRKWFAQQVSLCPSPSHPLRPPPLAHHRRPSLLPPGRRRCRRLAFRRRQRHLPLRPKCALRGLPLLGVCAQRILLCALQQECFPFRTIRPVFCSIALKECWIPQV